MINPMPPPSPDSAIELVLEGRVPSKKNAWRRGFGGRKAYLPAQVQADIDALIIQATSMRHKYAVDLPRLRGADLIVSVRIYQNDDHIDLDNAYTTLQDVLQKAGYIDDDRRVAGFQVYRLLKAGPEHVTVRIWKA